MTTTAPTTAPATDTDARVLAAPASLEELVECVERIVAERDTLARGLRAAIEWSSSGRPSITAGWSGLEGRAKALHDDVSAARALLDGPRREPPVEDEPFSWEEERHP